MPKASVQLVELIQAKKKNSSTQNQEQNQALLLHETYGPHDDYQKIN